MLWSPIDLFYFQYYQRHWNGDESIRSFDDALKAGQARKQGYALSDTTATGPIIEFSKVLASATLNDLEIYIPLTGT